MGNFQTFNNEQNQDSSINQMKIQVDMNKPVILQLYPLLNWSLRQIRQIYTPFRKRKGSPLLNRSQFLRFLKLSKISSFYLYDQMFKKHYLNVFQILSILVLTAYTNYSNKIQFLFNIFDLNSSKGIEFKQLILSFKSLIRGYCILTQQQLPDNDLLQKYAQIMFSRADLNNDQCLQIGEILSWFEGNVEGIYLFKKFQPEFVGKQQYHIFNEFISYTINEQNLIYERIQKQYRKIPLSQEDFQTLIPKQQRMSFNLHKKIDNQPKIFQRSKTSDKKNNITNSSKIFQLLKFQNIQQIQKIQNNKRTSLRKSISKFANDNNNQQIKRSSLKTNQKQNQVQNLICSSYLDSKKQIRQSNNNLFITDLKSFKKTDNFLRTISSSSNTVRQLNNKDNKQSKKLTRLNLNTVRSIRPTQKISQTTRNLKQINEIKSKFIRKKFQNIIILKGRSITKKQIFDLRDYFETISGGKKSITIQKYLDAFNEQKYNHMKSVAASLFNFLDSDQNGKVTFKQLVYKLYPDITQKHFKIITIWQGQYDQNFNLQKNINSNCDHEQFKKRILPKACLPRYLEIFKFFDKQSKGYVDIDDLKRVLFEVSNQKQLIKVLQDNDKDHDGKLNLKEFLHVLLPIDLQIQGL